MKISSSVITRILSTEKSRISQAQKIYEAIASENNVTTYTVDICREMRKCFRENVIPLDAYFLTDSGRGSLGRGLKAHIKNAKVLSSTDDEHTDTTNDGANTDTTN